MIVSPFTIILPFLVQIRVSLGLKELKMKFIFKLPSNYLKLKRVADWASFILAQNFSSFKFLVIIILLEMNKLF